MFGPEVDFSQGLNLKTLVLLMALNHFNGFEGEVRAQCPRPSLFASAMTQICPLAGSHWSVSPWFSVYFALESKMLELLSEAQFCLFG